MKKIAISIGDLNGIGIEIALNAHETIKRLCEPIYCVDEAMVLQACALLGREKPADFTTVPVGKLFNITPQTITKKSGRYSYTSFLKAIELVTSGNADALLTLPIHKKAWQKAGIRYHGHTDALRDIFAKEAIMMLGVPGFFVALYTEHIALKEVAKQIKTKKLERFLLEFYHATTPTRVGVLALNPHAGDDGVMGDEEQKIAKAIKRANTTIGSEIFVGPLVPDTAFTPKARPQYQHYVAMYHDQGLAPLKTLHFDEAINVSLGLPIKRVSVDHGTGFDIAYQKQNPSIKSYLNALNTALN